MSNLIDRQDAIDAVCMEWCGVKHQDCEHPFDIEKDDYYWCDGCETALRTLPELPSAEPEKISIARINLSEEQIREAVEKAKREIVQVFPSAEPERKRGRWIDEGFYADGHGAHAFRCSECGGHIIEYDADLFCRWCGADMREEGQDD